MTSCNPSLFEFSLKIPGSTDKNTSFVVRAVGNFCQFSSQKIELFLYFHSFAVKHDVVQGSFAKTNS